MQMKVKSLIILQPLARSLNSGISLSHIIHILFNIGKYLYGLVEIKNVNQYLNQNFCYLQIDHRNELERNISRVVLIGLNGCLPSKQNKQTKKRLPTFTSMCPNTCKYAPVWFIPITLLLKNIWMVRVTMRFL